MKHESIGARIKRWLVKNNNLMLLVCVELVGLCVYWQWHAFHFVDQIQMRSRRALLAQAPRPRNVRSAKHFFKAPLQVMMDESTTTIHGIVHHRVAPVIATIETVKTTAPLMTAKGISTLMKSHDREEVEPAHSEAEHALKHSNQEDPQLKVVPREHKPDSKQHVPRPASGATKAEQLKSIVAETVAGPKPRFVIHIGPPKTATTSLQTDLSAFAQMLLGKDGYYYAGRYYHPSSGETKNKILLHRSESSIGLLLKNATHTPECQNFATKDCFEPLRHELQHYRDQGINVIVSDEALAGKGWKGRPDVYDALKASLGVEWDVVIVLGYRYYFEWLVSSIYQWNRLDRPNEKKDAWPHIKVQLDDGTKTHGRELDQLFPQAIRSNNEYSPGFPDQVLDTIHGVFSAVVINTERVRTDSDNQSVRSHFLCEVLLDAPASCAQSLEWDRAKNETALNIHDDTYHVYYDLIAVAAAKMGLVDGNRFTRLEIREQLRHHNVNVLNQSYADFHVICPSAESLTTFLQESLQRQLKIFGPQSPSSMESLHIARFLEMENRKGFCTVDTNAVLSLDTWKEFFKQFAP